MSALPNQLLGFYIQPIVGLLITDSLRVDALSIIAQIAYEVRKAVL
jgi:hypothetical protein